jgi:predicted glycogen debranching enzyme
MQLQAEAVVPTESGWTRGDPVEWLVTREWLVTNGLGGYAAGTLGGACTRRFHGKLVAALPTPRGRLMMFNHLEESITGPDGFVLRLSGDDRGDGRGTGTPGVPFLEEFVLEHGLPLWRYSRDGIVLDKRVVMPYMQNTTQIVYRILEAPPGFTLALRPSLHFRPHEGLLSNPVSTSWNVQVQGHDVEISDGSEYPLLRIVMDGNGAKLRMDERTIPHVLYRIEKSRGYEHEGSLWSPGVMQFPIAAGEQIGIVVSVESWETVHAMDATSCIETDIARREALLDRAGVRGHPVMTQLVMAADQFLIRPHTRAADEARARASGDEARTVIAGYHWFTDWGRDTMISLEGLTLTTGRQREAGSILRTFASYIRDGLIPNMFPEGDDQGRYHTADATLWFFHALNRYLRSTNDRATVSAIVPRLVDIIDHHLRGTRFNIRVDPADGLLSQGADGYQLTWMDAKVDDWVVTPRRGKPVEINALFYNALCILREFLVAEDRHAEANRMSEIADRARGSFNERFWYEEGRYLYDVVDGEGGGNDAALRPNQIFALSLDYPVLREDRWKAVVDTVREHLLTPVGLRSLSRDHPDYKPAYDGDLRARDAAYHQGTVWSWLIGPFLDAWLRVYPHDPQTARSVLDGFVPHLGESCIGTISEVFDAEPPYQPRGCVAQAWGVAEVLRSMQRLQVLKK